ncbi:MAG: hypothetical protein U0324_38785 [Polyangiales bacterium]
MRSALALLALTGCTVGLDWTTPAVPADAATPVDARTDAAAPDVARPPDVAPGGCASSCRGTTPFCCGGQCRAACCADAQCTDGKRAFCCPSGACRACCEDAQCGTGRRCCNGQCQTRCG